MNKLAQLDHQFVWHPFTQMRDWLKREPVVIVAGKGTVLHDVRGREYLDANSSIWTNLHGHNHPKINAAIRQQLKKIAHSSALGLANEPASILAANLVQMANPKAGRAVPSAPNMRMRKRRGGDTAPYLGKVFFSDNGSTALEVALKLAYEFTRRTRARPVGRAPAGPKLLSEGRSSRATEPKFLSLEGAYHGDTVGAVSLGHIDLFHKSYSGLLFKTDKVMSPYCYRCPFNRAKPERADAREYRQCNWECAGLVEKKFAIQKRKGNPYAAFIFEPLIQGAAGMIPQPPGWLERATEIARSHGALLIADEVMTGFGRVGQASCLSPSSGKVRDRLEACPTLFACNHEGVQPDFLCLAKGLTGGYLPMAATLTTQKVFDAFLGEYDEFKTFFHGHSYTANQFGAAAALASLDILRGKPSIRARQNLEKNLHDELQTLWPLPNVGDIRQVGLIAGVELVRDWRTREPFDLRERAGIRVCEAMAKRGVLTRPVGNVIVLMPPYCATPAQARKMVRAVFDSIRAIFGPGKV